MTTKIVSRGSERKQSELWGFGGGDENYRIENPVHQPLCIIMARLHCLNAFGSRVQEAKGNAALRTDPRQPLHVVFHPIFNPAWAYNFLQI